MNPRYNFYIVTKTGEKIFAFTWSRGYDIVSGFLRCEREAREFGYDVREISYVRI